MPHGEGGEGRVRKRVSNACRRCRRHKIKCSGSDPCQVCSQKQLKCEFGSGDKKVVISESVLEDLKSRLNQLQQQQEQQQEQHSPRQELRQAQFQAQLAISQTADNPPTESLAQHEPTRHSEGFMSQYAISTAYHQGTAANAAYPSRQHNSAPGPGSSSAGNIEAVDEPSLPEDTLSSEQTGVSNPLVPEQPAFISDDTGKLRYLGTTSTWSFSRQVLRMAHQSPHAQCITRGPVHSEGEAYRIDLEEPIISPSDIAGLPSIDLSLYYLQTVKFRTYPLFHLFDETEFTSHLYRFYDSPASYAQRFRAWFVHYLILMAFAKSFIGPGPGPAQRSSGPLSCELFARAVRLLPEVSHLCRDPVASTELLCCIALYLQAIDHRSAANIYIGEAIRMAQSHGLHTDLQPEVLGHQLVHRGRRIWWTVYTLDRKLSCSMGLPNSLHDQDITAPLPGVGVGNSDINATGQAIHVKICRLLGEVVSTIYSRDGTLNKSYLSITQTILRGVADLASELKCFSMRCFGQISRVAAHLNLAYHHCILLASRPFLYFLLKFRLEGPTPSRTFPLSSSAKGLVQVCIDAAVQTISIVTELRQHELLDTFLPFDLECTFSAAFVLVMAMNVHPRLLPQDNWLHDATEAFDYMTVRGNTLGSIRKSEVEELARTLNHELGHQGNKSNNNNNNATGSALPLLDPPSSAPSIQDRASLPSLGDPFFDAWIADDGLSGAQIMDLADALQPGTFDDFML